MIDNWFDTECEDRFERMVQTLAIIALTLGDYRVRLETLERPTRWARFVAKWRKS